MSALCVIPARGGSKRIPGKNIRSFMGKPIMAYAIEAALGSKVFETVMVSTDDEEIAGAAKSAGATVPFLRSAQTADDQTGVADVVIEVLSVFRESGVEWDTVCCLLPTAVFVTAIDLRRALSALKQSDASAIVPIVSFDYPIQRSLQLDNAGFVSFVDPQYVYSRSQDLPRRYHDAGQYYMIGADTLRDSKSFFPPAAVGQVISETLAQDIDTEDDWQIAELKYHRFLTKNGK